MSTPSTPSRATELMAASSRSLRCTGYGRMTRPSRLATSSAWPRLPTWVGVSGLNINPIRVAPGRASLRSSTRLPVSPSRPCIIDTPVMLPPGRARLAAKPAPTGSPVITTTGMVVVKVWRADRKVTECDQDIRPELHQLGGKIGNTIGPPLAKAVVDDNVLPLDIAELLKPFAK